MESHSREAQDVPPSEYANGNASHHQINHATSDDKKERQPAWQNAIENFSPQWFSIPMSTGILGILMHQLPYQFHGLPVLATIMFVFDLVLFVVFAVVTILRWTMFPHAATQKTSGNLDEISFLGAPPIAFLTLTALTALIISNTYWGGHAWTIVAYVMWWFGMFWMFSTCIGVCITVFRTNVANDRSMTPSLVLPAVGVATAAVVGGLISNYAYELSPRLAVPVIIVGYFLAGLAIWISVILYGVFFHRLMSVGWPPGAKLPSLFMLVGPFGQSSAAVQYLGSAAMSKMDFAGYHRGVFLQASAASVVATTSVFFALLLLGHDIFWLCCALSGVLEGAFKRELTYSLVWWATIFPVATLATAFLSLSINLDSPTFRVLCTAILLILMVDFFINLGFTIWYTFRGDLLIKRGDEAQSSEKRK